MKGSSSLKDRLRESKSSTDDQLAETIADALSSNDKVIEIRPASGSTGMGMNRLLLLALGVIAFAYWVRNSQKSDELVGSVKEKAADRTHQAAETIEEGSTTVSERIEEGSERAGETVQEAGEKAAERTEEAGEKAAERTEEAGEKAAERTEEAGEKAADETASGSSGM